MAEARSASPERGHNKVSFSLQKQQQRPTAAVGAGVAGGPPSLRSTQPRRVVPSAPEPGAGAAESGGVPLPEQKAHSNQQLIRNAILRTCLAGQVNQAARDAAIEVGGVCSPVQLLP